MVKKSFFAGIAALVMSSSLHAEAQMAASLDILLDAPKCWELTPEGFEKQFDAIRPELFRWITNDRTRAKLSRALYSNAKIELTAFGGVVPVEEAVVDFSGGRLNMVTLSIFNRGDAGEISEADFKSRHIAAGRSVGAKLNAKPTACPANRQQGLVTEGYSWSSPSGVARVITSLRDEPACGSLRHMVPEKRPENSLAANTCFCKSVPCTISKLALPLVSMPDPMLTEAMLKKALAAASTV